MIVIKELLDNLHPNVGIISDCKESPSMNIIDSQSVKAAHYVDYKNGIDNNKKIKGRKLYIIVNIQGNLISISYLQSKHL